MNVSERISSNRWLFAPLLATTAIFSAYLLSHPYPAAGGGFFTVVAETIIENGYALPERISQYGLDGVPFAYPPLFLYVYAVLLDVTGLKPLVLTRVVPVVLTGLYVVTMYFLGVEILDSKRQAGIAAAALATIPEVFYWHITGGGIVRAGAYLMVLVGLYCGVRLFESGERRWLVLSTVAFGLTVLSHLQYILFFVVAFVLLFLGFDRTKRGLIHGIVVGVGGLLLTSPWWLTVFTTHGVDIFVAASNTRPTAQPIKGLTHALFVFRPLSGYLGMWQVVTLLGSAYLVGTGRVKLVVAYLLIPLALPYPRFYLVPAALIAGVFLGEGFDVLMEHRGVWPLGGLTREGVVAAVIVFTAATGAFYAADYSSFDTGIAAEETAMPGGLTDEDVQAMEWVAANTEADATFAVTGKYTLDWFPALTDRMLVYSTVATEWFGEAYWTRVGRWNSRLADCETVSCVDSVVEELPATPGYIYLDANTSMKRDIRSTSTYSVAYANDGVIILAVEE